MPPANAYHQGHLDGLRKATKAPSRCGYPGEYDRGYRHGLLERSKLRRALDHAGQFLLNLAVRV